MDFNQSNTLVVPAANASLVPQGSHSPHDLHSHLIAHENITTTGLDLSQTKVGQVVFMGDQVTMEIVGECEPCGKMDAIRPGLQKRLDHRRGMLATVINGGPIRVGDAVRIEP